DLKAIGNPEPGVKEYDPPTIAGELIPDQPDALRFRFVVDRDATYTIHFTSLESEENKPLPYTIKALRDMPPEVEFTKPLELLEPKPKDLQLPANGMLRLEGKAVDDYGLTKMTLRMKMEDGAIVAPKTYRDEKAFKLETGAYMRSVDYMDFVELDKLKT